MPGGLGSPHLRSLGRGPIPQPNGPKEGGVLAHVDGDVSVDHFHSNLLPSSEETNPSCVAGVEVGLPCLNTPSALQKRLFIHHHLEAGKICEVYVIHLIGSKHWGEKSITRRKKLYRRFM